MRAVQAGYDVVGLDVDEGRVKHLAAGESYVEDISDATLTGALDSGRYRPSFDPDDCTGFDVAVITVPTPLTDGNPDLSYVEEAALTLSRYLRPGAMVVLESTTYPGTTEELLVDLLQNATGLIAGVDFDLGYSPERIDPGNPNWTFANTPKIVSGVTAQSLAAVQAFYDTLVAKTVAVARPCQAEMAKLLENTFRHVNIALVNELAMYAAEFGIDIGEVIDAAATKPFGFMAFRPGPGVGGHCLPIDPSYLSWRVRKGLGRPFRFVELANDINAHMPDYVVSRVMVGLNRRSRTVKGSRILLLGRAYKPNTSDERESPALAVARLLVGLGARVAAADPYVVEEHVDPRVELVDLTRLELEQSDAVIVLTDHDAFDFEAVVEYAPYVFDTRRRLPVSDRVEHL
jgi:UDP-N-acetyl-D-glucosamine dehydrogenase